MNNPNPFLPNGVFLDQKNKARTRMKIAVLSSITLSSMVLLVLLIQGCKKPADSTDGGGGNTDLLTSTQQLANPQPETNTSNAATALANPTPVTNPSPVVNTPMPAPTPMTTPPPPVPEMQEYTIVKGDVLATIAKNNHVSTKAILDANPGIDPKKLKIGQKIKIPAAASSPSTSVSPNAVPMAADTGATGGAITYKVKSGDTLTTIAKKYHGVTIKAIQQANNLTTTSIKVGQVLKIPGAAAPAPASEAAPVPAPTPTTAPAPVNNGTSAPMH
jgi:LysM repeat protein